VASLVASRCRKVGQHQGTASRHFLNDGCRTLGRRAGQDANELHYKKSERVTILRRTPFIYAWLNDPVATTAMGGTLPDIRVFADLRSPDSYAIVIGA